MNPSDLRLEMRSRRAIKLNAVTFKGRARFFFMKVLVSAFFISLLGVALCLEGAETPKPSLEAKDIAWIIDRLDWFDNVEVIRQALRRLNQGLHPPSTSNLQVPDLTSNESLKTKLMNLVSDTQHSGVNNSIKVVAARLIGEAGFLNATAPQWVTYVGGGGDLGNFEAAVVGEMTRLKSLSADSPKPLPVPEILNLLKEKKSYSTLYQWAQLTKNLELIQYLIERAQAEKKPELIYGLDSTAAADLAAQDFLLVFEVPQMPTDLSVVKKDPTSLLITWRDQSLNEVDFQLDRGVDGTNYTKLVSLPNNRIAHTDPNLKPGTYYYRLRANGLMKNSEFTPAVSFELRSEVEPEDSSNPPAGGTSGGGSGGEVHSSSGREGGSSDVIAPVVEPSSPESKPTYIVLIDSLLLKVEGKPHAPTISALNRAVTEGPAYLAMKAAKALNDRFVLDLYDFSPAGTDLGLKTIAALDNRAVLIVNDYSISAGERQEYSKNLKAYAANLKKLFNVLQ